MTPDWSLTFSPAFLSSILPQMNDAKTNPKSAGKTIAKSTAAKPIKSAGHAALSAALSAVVAPRRTQTDGIAEAATPAELEATELNLRSLLEAIVGQSQSALSSFYDATVSRVYGVALRVARNPDIAEEIVSDVYMQVWRDANRYDESRGRVLGWLLIITRSRALDALRRQDEAFSHPEPYDLVSEPEDDHSGPQDLLLATESSAALHQALQILTPLQRQLLALAFFKGLSHSEIVEHAGIPLGSVKTHIRRALAELRDALGHAQSHKRINT